MQQTAKTWLRLAAGLAVGVAATFVLLVALTPLDRRSCVRQTQDVCDEGVAATARYSGIAGFSDCRWTCGSGRGSVTLIDRSWPFGVDR